MRACGPAAAASSAQHTLPSSRDSSSTIALLWSALCSLAARICHTDLPHLTPSRAMWDAQSKCAPALSSVESTEHVRRLGAARSVVERRADRRPARTYHCTARSERVGRVPKSSNACRRYSARCSLPDIPTGTRRSRLKCPCRAVHDANCPSNSRALVLSFVQPRCVGISMSCALVCGMRLRWRGELWLVRGARATSRSRKRCPLSTARRAQVEACATIARTFGSWRPPKNE